MGKMVHLMLEDGDNFMSKLAVEPEFIGMTKDGKPSSRSAEARLKKDEWRANLPEGTIIVNEEQLETITQIANSVTKHKALKERVAGGIRESSLWVKCPETGLLLQCRPDLIDIDGNLIDYKTSGSLLSEENIESMVYGFRIRYGQIPMWYAFQLAFYAYCLRIAGISKEDRCMLVFLETVPSWGMKLRTYIDENLEHAHKRMMTYLRKVAECEASNNWPNYDVSAKTFPMPEWINREPEFHTEEYE